MNQESSPPDGAVGTVWNIWKWRFRHTQGNVITSEWLHFCYHHHPNMNHGQPRMKNMGQHSNQQSGVLQSKAIQRWCFRENIHLKGFLLFYTVLTHLLQTLFQNSFYAQKRPHPPNKNKEGCFHTVSKGASHLQETLAFH